MPLVHANTPPSQPDADLGRLLSIQVPVIVKLAERKLPVAEVLRLGVGSIIEFVKGNDDPLHLMVNNKTIGVGEAVKVGENFGIRLRQIGDPRQILNALAGDDQHDE